MRSEVADGPPVRDGDALNGHGWLGGSVGNADGEDWSSTADDGVFRARTDQADADVDDDAADVRSGADPDDITVVCGIYSGLDGSEASMRWFDTNSGVARVGVVLGRMGF